MKPSWRTGLTALSAGALVLAHAPRAIACGGCFLPQATTETSVVTAHRMAFAISTTRTVLWDQIQYAGDPADFSWVLPVRGDAVLEASDDAWFESLEAVTSARISPPQLNCLSRSSGSGSGCACGGSSSTPTAGSSDPGGGNLPNGVTVTHEGAVGPYAYVQLKATSSASLITWLPANGYAVPESVVPVIDAYVREQFDFIALKLRPGFGTRLMTPVRVVTKGASPTLPLRMVAAGTGAFVGITLYVISESRFDASKFGHAVIDPARLTFDWLARKSNYAELRAEALAAGNGQNWLTTFAVRGALARSWQDALGQPITFSASKAAPRPDQGPVTADTFADLYFAQAAANSGKALSCRSLVAPLTSNDKVVDACAPGPLPEGGVVDAAASSSSEGGAAPGAAVIPKPERVCGAAIRGEIAASSLECGDFTDIAAATIGMHVGDVWITRLEANLPREALKQDLSLESAAAQTEVSGALRATKHVNPPCELVEDHPVEATLQSPTPGRAPVAHASLGFLSALGLLVARRLARKGS